MILEKGNAEACTLAKLVNKSRDTPLCDSRPLIPASTQQIPSRSPVRIAKKVRFVVGDPRRDGTQVVVDSQDQYGFEIVTTPASAIHPG